MKEAKKMEKGTLIKQTPTNPDSARRKVEALHYKSSFLLCLTQTHMYMLTEIKPLAASTKCLGSSTGKQNPFSKLLIFVFHSQHQFLHHQPFAPDSSLSFLSLYSSPSLRNRPCNFILSLRFPLSSRSSSGRKDE